MFVKKKNGLLITTERHHTHTPYTHTHTHTTTHTHTHTHTHNLLCLSERHRVSNKVDEETLRKLPSTRLSRSPPVFAYI